MSPAKPNLRVKRVYEDPSPGDGFRVLVDRLWPRGLTRRQAAVDLWLKDIAPSTPLRQWFHKDPARWTQFVTKYKAELRANPALEELRAVVRAHAPRSGRGVTLLFGAKDTERNHALVLLRVLTARKR